jgi:gluconolactonase
VTLVPRRVPVEILHSGFGFSEGPVALCDGSLAFCDGTNGTILRLTDGAIVEIADLGGAPNGLALGREQTLYVALMEPWRADQRAARPSIVRVDSAGAVATIATEGQGHSLVAPNDLAFSPEGRLYFTDSGDIDYRSPTRPSRIFALAEEGVVCVRELGPCYANGIAFDADARLVWTESASRRLCRLEGDAVRVLATLPRGYVPDGLAIARDGRMFVATVTARAIVVVSPDGELLDSIGVHGEPTNCALLDSRLVVTAATDSTGERGTGLLLAIETDAQPLGLSAGEVDR